MTVEQPFNPWHALWAMLIGCFMILVDSTIVAVANPSIMAALDITSYDTVIWVTSAYLLAYAVPLLVSGRLGDRFGTATPSEALGAPRVFAAALASDASRAAIDL